MRKLNLLWLLLPLMLLQSCGEEGNIIDSYISASVAGPSWNGTFRIQAENEDQLVATALISPPDDASLPDVLFISYNEPAGISVTMTIPAEKRITELIEDHEVFGMAMIPDPNDPDPVILISKTMSMEITKLKTTSGGLVGFNIPSEIVGHFEGVMVHKYWDDGEEIEESHIVNGDFKFYQ